MKLFVIFVTVIISCAVVSAQEREYDSDDSDRQSVQRFQRPSILGHQNPIRKIVGGIRERVREGVRGGSSLVANSIQSIIADVRKRTEQLELNIREQRERLKPQAEDAVNRLKALEVQKRQLNEKLKVVTNEFEVKKDEYRSALVEQKEVIDNQIKDSGVKDHTTSTQLKTEQENLDEKIKNVETLTLVPQPRGLGDGYGRHLK